MKISVILAHPNPGSFNHAIAEMAVLSLHTNGHEVIVHDLCAEDFDPILTKEEAAGAPPVNPLVKTHCDEIVEADGIIIVHPNWWGQPPAIGKGWVDRVLRENIAYGFEEDDSGEGVPVGLLNAKTAIVFNTSNTPEDRELAVFGDPLENLWKTCVFDFCGVKNFQRKVFSVAITSTPEQRADWLKEVRSIVSKSFL
jgi:putative NADPH-quinone reductase